MKSLHNTPHGEAMLELIDKLRGIQGLQKQIDLPQIVVVGQQSSGKSSVLNAISGLDFPTHHSICTRFPTELRLRRDEKSTAKAYIKMDQGENYEDFDAAWSNIDPNRLQEELPKLIESAQDVLIGKDSVAKVSSRSLVIQVSGPSLDHLTLVDLPGLFAAGRDGQSRVDIEAVEKIITSYIDQPLSIVLAVINAADDPENHKILQIIKERKDRASKTLGVLTKPDLLQGNDDDQERNRAAMLVHDDWNLGHGWHVVRNLKPNEIADGAVRDVLEDKFFAVNKVWKRGRELGRVGNAALKERLSLILGNSMSESLPDIGLQVHFELERVEDALTKMGDARLSSNDQIRYLQEQAKVFQESIGLSLSNEPPLFGSQRCFRLRSCLEEHYAAFVEQFDENGAVWKLDMKSSVSSAGPDAVKKAIDCRTGETVIVTATDLMDFLESQIQKNRIKILPNLVPHQWSAYLFQQQRARWLALSQQFIDKVFSAVEQTVNAAMADIRLEDGAKLDIGKTIRGRLSERKADADRKIRELHRPYEQPQLSCYTNRYKDTLKTNSIDTTERFQIIDTVRSAELYYHIASEMFVENVIQLAAEACLVDQLEDLFSPRMVLSWDTGTVERLGGEGDGNKALRNQYAADLTGLKQAHTLMLDFKARLGLWTPSASHPVAELDGPLRGLSIDTPAQPAVVVEDTTRVKKLHPERDGWHANGRKNGGRWVTNLGRPLPTPAPSVTDDDDVFDRRSSANSSAYSSPEPKRSTRLS